MVKNIAFPGIFYRINQFKLGSLTVMVRTQVLAQIGFSVLDESNLQVHAEDEEPMLEFEESSGGNTPEDRENVGPLAS
jgi:hypothetical protein